ncbi:MAG: MFS transporter, partial [Burkholderiaceae bacterium]
PILGGWIVKLLDWRSIFLFLFTYTVLLLWYCYKNLPESLPVAKRQPFNPRFLFDSYKMVFSAPLFNLKAGTIAFNFAGMFLYVAAAPVFITKHLGLGPAQFGWQFIPTVVGIFCGAFVANRFAGKTSIPKQVAVGYCVMISAALFNVGYHTFFPPGLPWSVAPLFFYTFGMSLIAPGATLLILNLFPHIRGTVSSCQSFTAMLLGAVVAGFVAPFLSYSVLWLATGQLACGLIGLSMWLASRSYRARLNIREKLNAWESIE